MHPEQGLAVLSRAAHNHNAIIVAISGGADSMLALDRSCQIARAQPSLQIVGWYLHHYESDIEPARVQVFSRATNRAGATTGGRFRLVTEKADIERIRRRLRTSWEHAASLTRRRRLRLLARRLGSAGLNPAPVVTGHNRSDYLETLALRKERLIPESAMPGNSVVDPVTGFYRPLAAWSRDEIRDLARHEKIIWYDDPANSDLGFARNRIRHLKLSQTGERVHSPPALPELRPISSREYRLAAEDFSRLEPAARSRLVHCAYRRLAISRRFTRNHFARAQKLPFALPPFFTHRENHTDGEQIIFRRGLAESLRLPAQPDRPYRRGDQITRSVRVKTDYGHKSVAKIFSEKKLSPRQRRQTIVYLQAGSATNADFIEFCSGGGR